jgi:hypothetical protein
MYTYGGDATLDGKINIDDYIKLDNGVSAHMTGWSNGDFNYDGKVNIDDYTIIDSNIRTQGAPIATDMGTSETNGEVVAAVPEASARHGGILAAGLLAARRRSRKRGDRVSVLPRG